MSTIPKITCFMLTWILLVNSIGFLSIINDSKAEDLLVFNGNNPPIISNEDPSNDSIIYNLSVNWSCDISDPEGDYFEIILIEEINPTDFDIILIPKVEPLISETNFIIVLIEEERFDMIVTKLDEIQQEFKKEDQPKGTGVAIADVITSGLKYYADQITKSKKEENNE